MRRHGELHHVHESRVLCRLGHPFPHQCRSCANKGAQRLHVVAGFNATWPDRNSMDRCVSASRKRQSEPG
nr:putative integron gene cassette protein [uncultured bacterium]